MSFFKRERPAGFYRSKANELLQGLKMAEETYLKILNQIQASCSHKDIMGCSDDAGIHFICPDCRIVFKGTEKDLEVFLQACKNEKVEAMIHRDYFDYLLIPSTVYYGREKLPL